MLGLGRFNVPPARVPATVKPLLPVMTALTVVVCAEMVLMTPSALPSARVPPTTAPVPVMVHDGVAECLPAAESSVDVVVSSLVLCSVADQSVALAEMVRVLRPGGLLLFYEHVRSAHRVLGMAEDLVTPLWSRVAGGCHPNRDTAAVIAAAGLAVRDLERFGFSALPGNPPLAHVLGVASKP